MNNNEKTYKIQEIIKWYKKFNNDIIKIKSKNKEFEINVDKRGLPHLLGLQYANITFENSTIRLKGDKLLNNIVNNNLSDQEILYRVKFYNENKLNNVANRIYTFNHFMENLEKGFIMEQTNKYTKIKSNYLIIQTKDNVFLQLGIKNENYTDLIVDYEIDDKTKEIFETYFLENDNRYVRNSKICEQIESIKKYNEQQEEYLPFSFDTEKQAKLDEVAKIDKNYDYHEALNKSIEEIKNEKQTINMWCCFRNRSYEDDWER